MSWHIATETTGSSASLLNRPRKTCLSISMARTFCLVPRRYAKVLGGREWSYSPASHIDRTSETFNGGLEMPTLAAVPVAQYLRMSTERQEYSIPNQTQAIATYAYKHGFTVVETYSDPASSGVLFRRRKGLQKLIRDIVQGQARFRAVLVYDVSRWGRFQDTDESAHYEYLCKSAGVRVHYCAESFSNDDSLPSSILKSLKRAMAGEYSRELGEKVFAGQQRGAGLGFRQGGKPGYGFRRLLVSPDGTPPVSLRGTKIPCERSGDASSRP